MAVTIETLDEKKWRQGKAFMFLYSDVAVVNDKFLDVVISTNSEESIVANLNITSNAELIEWQPFAGTLFTQNSGIIINPIARNLSAGNNPTAIVEVNPTISDNGTAFTANPIDLVAQNRANRAYLSEDVISSFFVLQANTNYLVRFQNKAGADKKFEVSIDLYNA